MFGLAGFEEQAPAGLGGFTVFRTTEEVRRFSTRSFATLPEDRPRDLQVEGRVRSSFTIERAVSAGEGGFAPAATSTVGDIELDNTDGGLDWLADARVPDGRPLVLKVAPAVERSSAASAWRDQGGSLVSWQDEAGDPVGWRSTSVGRAVGKPSAPPLAAFAAVLRGTVAMWSFEEDAVRVRIQDASARLRRPLRRGSLPATAGQEGVLLPYALGRCLNVPCVQVDPFTLEYQVHDGPMRAIDTVRDSGVRLRRVRDVATLDELRALVPVDPSDEESEGDFGPGEFAACLPEGRLRLGGLPAGAVTADVRGAGASVKVETWADGSLWANGSGWAARPGPPYEGSVGGMVLALLRDHAGLTAAEIDAPALRQLDAEESAEAGLYVAAGEEMTVEEAVGRLAASVGAVLVTDRLGRHSLSRLRGPSPGAMLRLDATQIERVDRLDLPWLRPWTTWRVGWGRNWSQLTEDQIAGVVPAAERARLTRRNAVAELSDDRSRAVYPEGKVGTVDSLLADPAAASRLAAALLALYAPGRTMYRALAKGVMFRVDLGQTVEVAFPRYGLEGGRRLLVVGVREEAGPGLTTLTLFG